MGKVLAAELLGTFWLVFGGCGSAVLAAAFPDVGIGLLGVSLAFGLTVLTMAYAIGHISGLPPQPRGLARTVRRRPLPGADVLPYIAAQVVGAVLGAGVLYVIASGNAGFIAGRRASPPTATPSTHPAATRWLAGLVAEVVLTFMFLIIILGATDDARRRASRRSPSASG